MSRVRKRENLSLKNLPICSIISLEIGETGSLRWILPREKYWNLFYGDRSLSSSALTRRCFFGIGGVLGTCFAFGQSMLSSFIRNGQTTSLEDFVAEDDQVTYGSSSRSVTTSYLFASLHLCHVNVINSYDTIPDLYQHLDSVDLLNNDRLRPGWDSYFMVDMKLNVVNFLGILMLRNRNWHR